MIEYFYTRVLGSSGWLVMKDGANGRVYNPDGQEWHLPKGTDLDDWLKRNGGPLERYERAPGEYYPRIWRGGGLWPEPRDVGLEREWRESTRVSRMLASRLQDAFRFVEPVATHKDVYSHELRMLFVLACMEVESACKEILFANGTSRRKGKKLKIDSYRKLAPVLRLDEWEVQLSTSTLYPPIVPFAAWSPTMNGSLPWYTAHNKVKHGRERELRKATLSNTIEACAAVFVLNCAQFGYPGLIERSTLIRADEFIITKEPAWKQTERYLEPRQVNVGGTPAHTPITPIHHPALV